MLIEYTWPLPVTVLSVIEVEVPGKGQWLEIECEPGGVLVKAVVMSTSVNEDGPLLTILVPDDQHGLGHLAGRIAACQDIGIRPIDPPEEVVP